MRLSSLMMTATASAALSAPPPPPPPPPSLLPATAAGVAGAGAGAAGDPSSSSSAASASSHEYDDQPTALVPRAALELLKLKDQAMDSVLEGITIADARRPDMPLIYVCLFSVSFSGGFPLLLFRFYCLFDL